MEKILYEVEEVDTRGEDDDYFYFETQKENIDHQIVKIGQPWNQPVDINDPEVLNKIKKQGQEARRLQELKEALSKLNK